MSKDAALPAPPAAGKKGKLILIVVVLLVVLLGAAGGYIMMARSKHAGADKEEPKKVEKKARVFAPLEPFTVNLRAVTHEQFLQIGLVFEVNGNEVADAIKAATPLIRGKVLLILTSKSGEELATSEGKARLAAELLGTVRNVVGGPAQAANAKADGQGEQPVADRGITDVHFSSFIIQ